MTRAGGPTQTSSPSGGPPSGAGDRAGTVRWGVAAFVVVAAWNAIWTFQGLHVRDPGFHLTNQWLVLRDGAVAGEVAAILLSDLAGAAWLALGGEPSVLWARLGGAFVAAASALAAFALLARHFPARRAFVAVAVGSVLIGARTLGATIHYFTFPGLLTTLLLLALDVAAGAPASSRAFRAASLAAGALAAAAAFSRLTLVLLLLLVPVAVAYAAFTRRGLRKTLAATGWAALGAVAAGAAILALYAALGVAGPFADGVAHFGRSVADPEAHVKRHGAGDLLAMYAGEAVCIAAFALAFAGAAAAAGRLAAAGRRVAGAAVVVAGLAVARALPDSLPPLPRFAPYSEALLGAAAAACAALLAARRRAFDRTAFVFALALAAALITPLGSNTGLYKSVHALWVALPLALLAAGRLADDPDRPRAGASLAPWFAALLAAVAVWTTVRGAPGDAENRARMTTPFASPALRGIRSTPDRVACVDAAVAEISARAAPGERVLVTGAAPMVYFVTGTRPPGPWTWTAITSLDRIRRTLDDAEAAGAPPRVVVFPRVDVRDRRWPRDEPFEPPTSEDDLVREWIGARGWREVWQNPFCRIWAPPAPR